MRVQKLALSFKSYVKPIAKTKGVLLQPKLFGLGVSTLKAREIMYVGKAYVPHSEYSPIFNNNSL